MIECTCADGHLPGLVDWVRGVPEIAAGRDASHGREYLRIILTVAKRLMDLGLGYLTLDRAASTLSTGGAPAYAAGPGSQKPHDRGAVCTG